MKKLLYTLLLLSLQLTTQAQDAVYLIGTDGTMEADHASATLQKDENGSYTGYVTFQNNWFAITTKLASTSDGWDDIKRYHFSADGMDICVGEEKGIFGNFKYYQDFLFTGRLFYTYWVKVTLNNNGNYGTIAIYEQKNDDPEYAEEEQKTELADIDLTSGTHAIVSVPAAGMLKQRLAAAAEAGDYDVVDFLTVRGKLGGADLAYLQEQKGWVSQLQYIDLSDVELVYDDEPYYTYVRNKTSGTFGGFQVYEYHTYTLSAENEEEAGDGGRTGVTSYSTILYRRNDLSYAFCNMPLLKQIKLPKQLKGIGECILSGTPVEKVEFPTAPEYVGDNAFYLSDFDYEGGCRLKGVALPSTVTRLGNYALMGIGFSTIDISKITELGEGCLQGTNISSVNLNSGITSIPAGAFSNCKWLTSVTIPGTVEVIGSNAFSDCAIKTLVMQEGIRVIGSRAFSGNDKLDDITVPNSLEEIGKFAFFGKLDYGVGQYHVPYIENMTAEDGVKYIGKVAYTFTGGSSIKIKEGTVSLADGFLTNHNPYGNSHSSEWGATVTLPSTLRILGKECLKDTPVSSIELPDNLEIIREGALANSKLRRVTIPKSVALIERGAFEGSSLVRVNYNAIDAEERYIERTDGSSGYTRIFPESLVRVVIGEGVRNIPASMFYACENLARVEMASTVETIGDHAFQNCSSLIHIDLPSSLKHIGDRALDCRNLQYVSSYIREPMALWVLGAEYISTSGSADVNPFGDMSYSSERGEDGKVTWNYYTSNQIPLLKVPNGTLSAYKAEKTWATVFLQTEQFDGASDAKAVSQTTTMSMSQTVTESTDLTSKMLGSVYATLDTEVSGDGYNASEGCLIINSTPTVDGLAAATANNADDLTMKNQFNGLMVKVPAGRGSITLDCQTLGSRAIYVKAGQDDPEQLESTSRSQQEIPYNVKKSTRIFIYGAPVSGSASSKASAMASTDATAYANDDAVKIYGLTVRVDAKMPLGDVNADSHVTMADANMVVGAFLGMAEVDIDAADVNGDGIITMSDANGIVNIFLSKAQ